MNSVMDSNNQIEKPKPLTEAQKQIIEGAEIIRMRSAYQSGAIGYMPTILINGCLPHSEVDGRIFERKNGRIKVTYVDVHNVGLPYGALPRLIMVWIATEVVLKKSRRINFDSSLAAFLRILSMKSTGGGTGSIGRVKKQFVSLMSCAIGYEVIEDDCKSIETIAMANKQHYWWSSTASEEELLERSYIELSQDFYEQIISSSAPVDTRALDLLRGSPLAMDIYVWVTYKMSIVKAPLTISWATLRLQIGVGYSGDKKGLNRFQQAFKRHLVSVLAVYPEANIELIRGRVLLKPGKPHIPKKPY